MHHSHTDFQDHYNDDLQYDLSYWGRVQLDLKTSSATSFHNLASLDHDKDKDKDRYLKETGALWVVYILTSRSGKESAVEFFLDELAEVEPAKVAPELLSINSDDDDDDSDDGDYSDDYDDKDD